MSRIAQYATDCLCVCVYSYVERKENELHFTSRKRSERKKEKNNAL